MPTGSKQRDRLDLVLPFQIGRVELQPTPLERRVAWALYLEVVTRLPIMPADHNKGLLRDALDSLAQLFPATRAILREAGPDLPARRNSVAGIAINVLCFGIRPFLEAWHPMLLTWENKSIPTLSAKEHELEWPQERRLHRALQVLNGQLEMYCQALAEVAGVEKDLLLPASTDPYKDIVLPQPPRRRVAY